MLSTYVPVDYEKEEGRPWLLDSDQKDPLSEDTLRFHSLDLTRLKLEPVDRSYQIDYSPKVLSTKLPVMCSIPTPNLIMVSYDRMHKSFLNYELDFDLISYFFLKSKKNTPKKVTI